MTDPAHSSPRTPPPSHAELRRLAEAATPGPWHTGDDDRATTDGVWATTPTGEDYDEGPTYLVAWFHGDWKRDDDAAFVAAANPATILALLDELAEARRTLLAELRAEVERLAEEHGTAITQGGNFVVGEQLIEAIDVLALVDRHLREGEAAGGEGEAGEA